MCVGGGREGPNLPLSLSPASPFTVTRNPPIGGLQGPTFPPFVPTFLFSVVIYESMLNLLHQKRSEGSRLERKEDDGLSLLARRVVVKRLFRWRGPSLRFPPCMHLGLVLRRFWLSRTANQFILLNMPMMHVLKNQFILWIDSWKDSAHSWAQRLSNLYYGCLKKAI